MLKRLMLWRSLLAFASVATAACSDSHAPLTGPHDTPLRSISDGAHRGNPHFFFLPPMVNAPTYNGTFDATLAPAVRICQLQDANCGPDVAEYTNQSGPGAETVRVTPAEEHYIVNWHTDRFSLDPKKTYRIRVFAGNRELGHADVQVVSSGKEIKNVDTGEFIPLINGRTLPIKFRIEHGALTYNPGNPGGPTTYDLVYRLSSEHPILHINSLDPVAVTVPNAGSEVLQYWSTRSATGMPTGLNRITTRTLSDPQPLEQIVVDENGTPRYFRDRDGSQIYLDIVSDTRLRLRIVTPDGNETIVFADKSTQGGQSASFSVATTGSSSAGKRSATEDQKHAARRAADRRIANEQESLARTASSTFSVGDPEIRVVQATIQAEAGGQTAPITRALVTGTWRINKETVLDPITVESGAIYFPENSPTGVWFGQVNFQPANITLEQFSEMCQKARDKAGTACSFLSAWGGTVQSACQYLGPKYVGTICKGFFDMLDRACDKGLGNCDLATKGLDAYLTHGKSIEITVTIGGYQLADHTAKQTETFEPPAPNPMPFDFKVPLRVSLVIDPADPAPFQGYQATTELIPALAEIPVSMSMWGTDGYSQSRSGPSDAWGRYSMFIPGAFEGVQDHITTRVLGVTRTTSIVF